MYPDPRLRQSLFLVVGELHNSKRPEPAEHPRWLTIPDRGLYTGIAVFGAIGSGKTSCCMYPFAEQIFAYKAADPERRASALVLEVKGDFCYKVAALLKKLGREADYVEVGLEGRYRYNPLHNDLEAYALAYGIASLLNNLFGKGKEPFWQQAYTNLVKFIILLHKVNYDYVTLFDVYECAINPEVLESRIREGERLFETEEYVLVSETDYVSRRDLAEFPFEKDAPTNEMKSPVSADLLRHLDANRIPYSLLAATGSDAERRARRSPVAKARTVGCGQALVLSRLAADRAEAAHLDRRGHLGVSFPVRRQPIGQVLLLPAQGMLRPRGQCRGQVRNAAAAVRGVDRARQGLRAELSGRLEPRPGASDRHADEAGLSAGDAQSHSPHGTGARTARGATSCSCATSTKASPPSARAIPPAMRSSLRSRAKPNASPSSPRKVISSLRSTLPGESWRTLLQTFRTKIFLSLSDDFSARTASELCGKEEQLKLSYSLSENDQDAHVSVLSGRAASHRATISTSKSYNLQRDWVFEPKIFTELKNAQSIVLAYDGVNPIPASYCYLKPYYLDPNRTYFEQLARGEL